MEESEAAEITQQLRDTCLLFLAMAPISGTVPEMENLLR
jgi:hypothetical protein